MFNNNFIILTILTIFFSSSLSVADDFSPKGRSNRKTEAPKVFIRPSPSKVEPAALGEVKEMSKESLANKTVEVGVSGKKVFTFSEESFYGFYSDFLEEYVNKQGQLSYSGIAADPSDLNKYLGLIKNFPSEVFDKLSEPQQIAFWINAYNALTIKIVADNFPIKKTGEARKNENFPANSVRQISGFWSGVRKEVMGKVITLQDIEQNVLRKKYNEPRIHIALVKASKSSPLLLSEPYFGSKLESQLSLSAKAFLRDPSKFVVEESESGPKVRISPIFDWYARDFAKKYKPQGRFSSYPREYASVLQFISGNISEEKAEFLERKALKVIYLEYDWRLNDVNVPAILSPIEDPY